MLFLNLLFTTLLNTNANGICPKINGNFKCNSQGDLLEISIDYKPNSETSTYIINEELVIADGKNRFFEDENIKNGKVSGTCVNNNLRHHLMGYFQNSKKETYGRVNLISVFRINENNRLEIIQSGEYFFDSYGEIPIDNVIKCFKP